MDISFYALLTVACLVLVLAMWACAAASTSKWGPDLTLELPPHLWQEILFRNREAPPKPFRKIKRPAPSAPSESAGAPLLTNEHLPINPLVVTHTAGGVTTRAISQPAVRVLPPHPLHSKKPVFSTFSTDEPV